MSNNEPNPYYDQNIPPFPYAQGEPQEFGELVPPAQEAFRPSMQEDTAAGQLGEAIAKGGEVEVEYTTGDGRTDAQAAPAPQERTPVPRGRSYDNFAWGAGRSPRTDRNGTSPGRGHTPPSGQWPQTRE